MQTTLPQPLSARDQSQIKTPTQMPYYRGVDTDLSITSKQSRDTLIPPLYMDNYNDPSRSVFSPNCPAWSETVAFFSPKNFDILIRSIYQTLTEMSPCYKNIEVNKRVLYETMIRVYLDNTPRRNWTDVRANLHTIEVTDSYVNELDEIVWREAVPLMVSEYNATSAWHNISSGKASVIDTNGKDSRTRQNASYYHMEDYHMYDRGQRSEYSDAIGALPSLRTS